MSAVTIDEAWPGFGSASRSPNWTGCLMTATGTNSFDGVLVVSPRPTTVHQYVATRLASLLDRSCPEDLGCCGTEPAVPTRRAD